MHKKILGYNVLIQAIFFLFFQGISLSQDGAISNATNWLISQQTTDGSWGKRIDLPTTVFSILALENSGLDVTSDKEHLTGITYSTAMELAFQYLATKNPSVYTKLQVLQGANGSWDDSLSTTSLVLIAISETGGPNSNAINYLKSSQDTTNGSWQNSVYLTSLSLIALIKSGDTSEQVSSGIEWLIRTQEPNGSWNHNLIDTSLSVLVFYLYGGHDQQVTKGIDFISSSLNTDGGWGSIKGGESSVYPTSVVLYGLSQYGRATSGIQDAINYLYANKNSDVCWYEDSLSIRDTAETILTFLYMGKVDTIVSESVSWIYNKTPKNIQEISLKTLVLSEYGIGQSLDSLLAFKNPDGGFGISSGFLSQIDDTISVLQAIASVDTSQATSTIDYLISSQNEDGGWGVVEGGESNVYITAMAASVLQQFPRTTSTSTAINEATDYLISHQNTDGGFGNVYETSLAYLALLGITTDTTVLGNAIEYLTSTQRDNGSWDDDNYATALALRALHSAVSPAPEPLTGTVTGKAIDSSTNQPLDGVSVLLQSDQRISTITDITGSFTLSNVPEGSQNITLSISGYVPATITVEITAGSIIDVGNVPITPEPTTGIIKGTVTDAVNGQPLEGVTITGTGAFAGTGITDSQGSFIWTNVSPGEVTITASKTGYYSVTGTGTVTAGTTLFFNPVISTTPPDVLIGNLTGKVFDSSTNVPIQGALISLSGGPSGTTDGQGVFLIKDITPATYQVTISRTGYTSQTYQVMIMSGVPTDMQTVYLIPILQWTTVTGKVTDASTGNPIQDGEITIVGTNITTKTDSTGTYTISGITLLEFSIRSSAVGYDSKTYNVQTTGYGIYTIDFALNPSQISGLKVKTLILDKQGYLANEDALITATIENTAGTEIQALVLAQIQDNEGKVIALVSPPDPQITVGPLAEIQKTIEWNTGQFQPGGYSIILKLTDPETVGYTNPIGNIIAERSISIFILSTQAISGAISLSPPVTQVDMQTPITITSAVRNTGNIPVTANLILEASLNEVVLYTQALSIVNLQVNNVQNLDFGSFLPQEGGSYLITLKSQDPAITSNISTILYVGPHATATFAVTPEEAFPGDVQVKGNIHITGAGRATGTTQDPLVPLIKEAIQKGVNYT